MTRGRSRSKRGGKRSERGKLPIKKLYYTSPGQPNEVCVECDGTDMFVTFDGVKIAKRAPRHAPRQDMGAARAGLGGDCSNYGLEIERNGFRVH